MEDRWMRHLSLIDWLSFGKNFHLFETLYNLLTICRSLPRNLVALKVLKSWFNQTYTILMLSPSASLFAFVSFSTNRLDTVVQQLKWGWFYIEDYNFFCRWSFSLELCLLWIYSIRYISHHSLFWVYWERHILASSCTCSGLLLCWAVLEKNGHFWNVYSGMISSTPTQSENKFCIP